MPQSAMQISDQTPFSKGGNRLCYIHPRDPACCLKVLQERSLPEERRKRKGWLGYLRPPSTFDENQVEYRALTALHKNFCESTTQHMAKSLGLVETDLGQAHAMELIRDSDGRISQTLEQYVWAHGIDAHVQTALAEFTADWILDTPPTRELLPHNLLLRISSESTCLILIDGFGRKGAHSWYRCFKTADARKYINRLAQRLTEIIRRRESGEKAKPRIGQLIR